MKRRTVEEEKLKGEKIAVIIMGINSRNWDPAYSHPASLNVPVGMKVRHPGDYILHSSGILMLIMKNTRVIRIVFVFMSP